MKKYSNVLTIFLIWILVIITIFYLGFSTIPHQKNFTNNFWQSFANWDGGHFLGIAQYGYSQNYQYAFFPLYPAAINFLTKITENFLLSSILISLTALFLGLIYFYKLVNILFDKVTAENSIINLLIFPTAFFFATSYSESLFFFLSIGCFYYLIKKKLLLATVFAIFASATRLVGLALFLAIMVEMYTTNFKFFKNWYIFLAPLGFLVYCGYLYIQTGDPFYFLTAQMHWQTVISVPGLSIIEAIKALSKPEFFIGNFKAFIDLIITIFGLGLVLRSFRFLPPSFSIYSLILLVIPLLTPNLSSIPRFILPIFPVFIVLALVKNQKIMLGYQLFSIMLLCAFAILFISNLWVS